MTDEGEIKQSPKRPKRRKDKRQEEKSNGDAWV